MRGEDPSIPCRGRRSTGSPPHARGRLGRPLTFNGGRRITPACAGKTLDERLFQVLDRDHPRMRGEDSAQYTRRNRPAGSPPHARGRLAGLPRNIACTRITPACAGKTTSKQASTTFRRDHPRMRGEDGIEDLQAMLSKGSPPHARGRQYRLTAPEGFNRITPACAGKTPANAMKVISFPDHPRMRGEDAVE